MPRSNKLVYVAVLSTAHRPYLRHSDHKKKKNTPPRTHHKHIFQQGGGLANFYACPHFCVFLSPFSMLPSPSPMETSEPQRRGWFSWLRPSIRAPSQPKPADARGEIRQQRGQFFPFLGSNASSRRTPSRPAASITSRNNSTHGGAGSVSNEERGDSTGRVAVADEKQLKREIPSIWKYLQEQEGWSFVNNRNWDVRGPGTSTSAAPAAPAAGGGGGRGSGVATQNQAGPMPQAQVRGVLTVSIICCCRDPETQSTAARCAALYSNDVGAYRTYLLLLTGWMQMISGQGLPSHAQICGRPQ